MPRIFVAFRTDVDPVEKLASGSETTIKSLMRGPDDKRHVGAEYTLALFNMKADVESICKAIVDVTDLDAEWSKTFRVNDAGQLREIR